MSLELWFAFVATSTVVLVIPGPTILTVVSYSAAHGRRAYVPILCGVVLGDATAIILSLLGLGALLATSALLFTVVKWIGGLYLIYLGARLLTMKAAAVEQPKLTSVHSGWRLFGRMYPVAFLNPKGIVFYVSFFPQFTRPGENVATQLALLALTFIVLGMLNVTFYSVFVAYSRRVLSTPRARRGFNILGGSLLTSAGLYALLAKKPA